MNKERTGPLVETLFKEIENCDRLLSKYEDMGDPLVNARLQWKLISPAMLDRKRKIEEMKRLINTHIQKLIALLDQVISKEPVKCKSCNAIISGHHLITIPDAKVCLECRLKPVKVSSFHNNQHKL